MARGSPRSRCRRTLLVVIPRPIGSSAARTGAVYAVRAGTGKAAASSKSALAGFGATAATGARTRSAHVPFRFRGSVCTRTSSPTASQPTSSPIAVTMPEATTPSAMGGGPPICQVPIRASSSQFPTPAARTSIKTLRYDCRTGMWRSCSPSAASRSTTSAGLAELMADLNGRASRAMARWGPRVRPNPLTEQITEWVGHEEGAPAVTARHEWIAFFPAAHPGYLTLTAPHRPGRRSRSPRPRTPGPTRAHVAGRGRPWSRPPGWRERARQRKQRRSDRRPAAASSTPLRPVAPAHDRAGPRSGQPARRELPAARDRQGSRQPAARRSRAPLTRRPVGAPPGQQLATWTVQGQMRALPARTTLDGRERRVDTRTRVAASGRSMGCPSVRPLQRWEETMTETTEDPTIRPFQVSVPEDDLVDLRRRISSVRWPSRELVADRSQGVQLATVQELARYWATEYDWRRCEARLNALPQFMTEIDGVDIHFVHVRSPHADALPLIMTHGWPGSVIELLETVGPLTDPTAHGGAAADAFDLVLPSIPGYGFSGEPTEVGWGPGRVAEAWAELMRRLGYPRYVAQGGDVGASITDAMARQASQGLLGIHTNLLVTALGGAMPADTEQERAALDALTTFRASGFGYFLEQATRPQTIGYALLDSPVALAAWMLDHDTDSYYKISRAFVDKQPADNLTRDHILDNVTP